MTPEEKEKLVEQICIALFMADGHLLTVWPTQCHETKQAYQGKAAAVLHVLDQHGGYAPEGFWIAPDEPTKEIFEAIISAAPARVRDNDKPAFRNAILRDYRAMRDAHIKPQTPNK